MHLSSIWAFPFFEAISERFRRGTLLVCFTQDVQHFRFTPERKRETLLYPRDTASPQSNTAAQVEKKNLNFNNPDLRHMILWSFVNTLHLSRCGREKHCKQPAYQVWIQLCYLKSESTTVLICGRQSHTTDGVRILYGSANGLIHLKSTPLCKTVKDWTGSFTG